MPIPYAEFKNELNYRFPTQFTCDGCDQEYRQTEPAYMSENGENDCVNVYCSHYCYYDTERGRVPGWVLGRDEIPAEIYELARRVPDQ